MCPTRNVARLRYAGLALALSVSVTGVYQVVELLEQHADRYPQLLEETQPVLSARDGIPRHNWDLDGSRSTRSQPAQPTTSTALAQRD